MLYDNEGTPEKPGGFWLINEQNEKQPIWHTHERYFEWARKQKPSSEESFCVEALKYLRQEQAKNP